MNALIWVTMIVVAGALGVWMLRGTTHKARPPAGLGVPPTSPSPTSLPPTSLPPAAPTSGPSASAASEPLSVQVEQAIRSLQGTAATSTVPAPNPLLASPTTAAPAAPLAISPVTGGEPARAWAWAALSAGLLLRWLVGRGRRSAVAGR